MILKGPVKLPQLPAILKTFPAICKNLFKIAKKLINLSNWHCLLYFSKTSGKSVKLSKDSLKGWTSGRRVNPEYLWFQQFPNFPKIKISLIPTEKMNRSASPPIAWSCETRISSGLVVRLRVGKIAKISLSQVANLDFRITVVQALCYEKGGMTMQTPHAPPLCNVQVAMNLPTK